jgi:hypothetical protein
MISPVDDAEKGILLQLRRYTVAILWGGRKRIHVSCLKMPTAYAMVAINISLLTRQNIISGRSILRGRIQWTRFALPQAFTRKKTG